MGSLADDEIDGRGGNDVIVATEGVDTLTGGNGDDVFFYSDITDITDRDIIVDFTRGSDRLDISEPLILSGYTGDDPIADGYVAVNSLSNDSLEIQFDPDGTGGQPASTFVTLENINPIAFQNDMDNQFIFTPTEF